MNKIVHLLYDGSYVKTQIGFLTLEIKPWHYINDENPYYLIPLTLHCTDTCGDVWQRFNVSMQSNQGIWVAKETINIDYTRLEKPYNLQIKAYCAGNMTQNKIAVDIGYTICGQTTNDYLSLNWNKVLGRRGPVQVLDWFFLS